MFRLVIPT